MARPEFETVVAQAPRKSVVTQDLSRNTNLAVGATETIYVYAPSGYVCNLNLYTIVCYKIAAATSGDIATDLSLSTSLSTANYIWGSSLFGADLMFQLLHWKSATNFKYPPTNEALNIKALWFDSVSGLRIQITNGTNAPSGATQRQIFIQYTQELVSA